MTADTKSTPYNVLSIDGGGIRGLYAARFLVLLQRLAKYKGSDLGDDLGRCFDLIAGTSTGAILGCAVAVNLDLEKIVELYRRHGKHIFPKPLPEGPRAIFQRRSSVNSQGDAALRKVLKENFGDWTIGKVFAERKISLSIPAVNLLNHQGWVFKTPHVAGSSHRDDGYLLSDVCLASTAAPIFRSIASVNDPNNEDTMQYFVDGGLWANNPVLVGLTDALQCAENHQPIRIFCLGTVPGKSGTEIDSPHWGLYEWKFGSDALLVGMDSQSHVYDHIARLIGNSIDREVQIYRFYQPAIPDKFSKYLRLDQTSGEGLDYLESLAREAIDETNSRWQQTDSKDHVLLSTLFNV